MLCKKLIIQLQAIQEGQSKLNQKIEGFNNLKKSESARKAQTIYLKGLYQSRKELNLLIKELKKEFFNPIIETKNYITAEGQPTQETAIKIDFEVILASTVKFYNEHEITLPQDFEARAKDIWTNNYEAIQKEIATYGYDNILIIPNNLPSLEDLHVKMTVGYAETYQGTNFKDGESFAEAKNSKSKNNAFRLVLTHNTQNLEDHLLLKATKGKSPEALIGKNEADIKSGKSKADIEAIIAKEGELPINCVLEDIKFGSDKTTKNNLLQAEGLTLAEYLIFQRQYFEVTGKHLDEKGWTWLLATFSAHRLSSSYWNPSAGQLAVHADDADDSDGNLGCRPSRSFFFSNL